MLQSVSFAQTTDDRPFIEVTGPIWAPGEQIVVTCKRVGDNENCVKVAVPLELGQMTGIIKLRPLRNTTSAWLAFTTKTIAVCGMQISTREIACAEIEGMSGDLRPSYPISPDMLPGFIAALGKVRPQLSAAGTQVRDVLSPPAPKKGDDQAYSPTAIDGEDGCAPNCVEDIQSVYVYGYGYMEASGGGVGNSPGFGGPTVDPDTGLPIQQVFVYPPPPKWPSDLTWCSLIGLLCADTTQIAPPSPEACQRSLQACYEECTSIYEFNKDYLPGPGPDYPARYRVCVRQCMSNHGCENY